MNGNKFQREHDIVERFVRLLGYTEFSLADPNAGQKTDTGADVLLTLDGRRYGIQVTVYHSDEAMNRAQKGSDLRRQEAVHKASTAPYAMYGNPIPWTALEKRIADKCKKQYSPTAFDELVLLIVASVPELGAVGSTLILDLALDVERMNATFSPNLQSSTFSSAYLYNMMGKGGPSVYEWTRKAGTWREIPRTDVPEQDATRWQIYPMNTDLHQATRKILMTEGDGKLALTDDDPDSLFVHSLVNYAKAKQQAAGIMKILHDRQSDEKRPDSETFYDLLKKYVPRIEPTEAAILFEAIVKDNES
jgi:hypothetical protein